MDKHYRKIIISFFAVIFIKTAVLIYLVPLWQLPDEPTHMEHIYTLVKNKKATPDYDFQKRVLVSMAENQYWKYVFMPAPEPLPEKFAQAPHLSAAPSQLHRFSIHYYLAALFFFPARNLDLRVQVYYLRWFSGLLFLLNIFLFYKAAALLFPEKYDRLFGLVMFSFIPQYSLLGISINNDILSYLFSSLILLSLLKAHSRGNWVSYLVIVPVIILALFVKRTMFIFLPGYMLFIIIELLYKKKYYLLSVFIRGFILLAALNGAYNFLTKSGGLLPDLRYLNFSSASFILRNYFSFSGDQILTFNGYLFKSMLFCYGWMAFWLKPVLYNLYFTLFGLLAVLSLSAILRRTLNKKNGQTVILFFSFIMLFLSLLSVNVMNIVSGNFQGRYALLVMPFVAIFLTGAAEWFKKIKIIGLVPAGAIVIMEMVSYSALYETYYSG